VLKENFKPHLDGTEWELNTSTSNMNLDKYLGGVN